MSIQMFMYYSKHQNTPSMKIRTHTKCFLSRELEVGGDLDNLEVIYISLRVI